MGGTYDLLVYAHVLAFVLWFGGDLGVAVLGGSVRDRSKPIATRLEMLRLMANIDMGPRSAWVAMVPLSITLVDVGGYWDVPSAVLITTWIAGAIWLAVIWTLHLAEDGAITPALKVAEVVIKIAMTLGFAALGVLALQGLVPHMPPWLAYKALIFAAIFVVGFIVDLAGQPVRPLLMKLIQEGSSDLTEVPLAKAMGFARLWVWGIYILLFAVGYLGSVKPS